MQSMAINIRPNLQPNSDVQTNAITHKFHYQPLNYIESDFYSNIFFIRMYSKQFISGSVFWCWCQLKPPPPSAVWPFGTDAISKQDKTAKRMQQNILLNKQTNNGLQQIIFKQTNKCKYVQQTNNKPTHSKNHMKCWTTTMSVLIPLKLELDPTYKSQESERESLQMFFFSLKPEKVI